MCNDVGPSVYTVKWDVRPPAIFYEVSFNIWTHKGSVYIGVYFKDPPKLSPLKYVQFDIKKSQVITSRYVYNFSPKNYLIVNIMNW